MIGNYDLGEWIVASKDDVASVLPFEGEILLEKNSYNIASGNAGQLIHTATRSASKRSGGIANPSSFRVSTYASIASRIF